MSNAFIIVPGKRLGPFLIGENISTYSLALQKRFLDHLPSTSWIKVAGLYHLEYEIDNLSVIVDVRRGVISRINTGRGINANYRGVGVGMSLTQALEVNEHVWFDGSREVVALDDEPGIEFAISIDDPSEQELLRAVVVQISVLELGRSDE